MKTENSIIYGCSCSCHGDDRIREWKRRKYCGACPDIDMRSDGYEVGDIAYWAPGSSLVILYAQNGEQFERQHIGHIDSGVEVFESIGDVDVTFELMD